jgi:hypothetical protein
MRMSKLSVSPTILTPMPAAGDCPTLDITPLLGTDQLVTRLRGVIPGGLSKRTIYQWLDLGCPHIELPGRKKKLAFVLDEVFAWIMSHRVEKCILPAGRGRSA